MKINITMESSSSRENQLMLYKWGEELAEEYNIDPTQRKKASFAFVTNEKLIPMYIKFVKNKYGLSLSHFHIVDKETTLAVGFDIEEDEVLTKFLLAR